MFRKLCFENYVSETTVSSETKKNFLLAMAIQELKISHL